MEEDVESTTGAGARDRRRLVTVCVMASDLLMRTLDAMAGDRADRGRSGVIRVLLATSLGKAREPVLFSRADRAYSKYARSAYPGGWRVSGGRYLSFTLPPGDLEEIDASAAALGMRRSEYLRARLWAGMPVHSHSGPSGGTGESGAARD